MGGKSEYFIFDRYVEEKHQFIVYYICIINYYIYVCICMNVCVCVHVCMCTLYTS